MINYSTNIRPSNWLIRIVIILLTSAMLCACQQKDSKTENIQTTSAEMKPTATVLYYSGTIEPIEMANVSSPIEGQVKKINFQMGRVVKEKNSLVVIESEKLEDDFMKSFGDYLKAKKKLSDDIKTYKTNQDLFKDGFIAKDDLDKSENDVSESTLAYIRSRYNLKRVFNKMDLNIQLEQFNILDVANIKKSLIGKPLNELTIYAPMTGVALPPPKGSEGSEELQVGSKIKEGEPFVTIGDLSGLSVHINVNEKDINRIKSGQKVELTGVGFDGTLNGTIEIIEETTKSGHGSSSLATFPVKIIVKDLTEQQRQEVHVGMTVKVKLSIKEPPQLLIPVSAVYHSKGASMVNVVDPETNKTKAVQVETGEVFDNNVAVLNGLKAGDKVVTNPQAVQ